MLYKNIAYAETDESEQVAREACFFRLKTCQVLVDIHGFVTDIMNRVMRW